MVATQAAGTISFSSSTINQQLGSDGPQVIHLADVNEDGFADLLTVDRGTDTLTIYLNQRNGTFDAGDGINTDAGPVAVATGDFNSDGDVDIITVNQVAGTVSVFLGDGSGIFATAGRQDTVVAAAVIGVAVADFDDDGTDDAAVLTGGRMYPMRSSGDGRFTFFVPAGLGTRSANSSSFAIAVGEIDADSSPDIVISNRDDAQLVIYLSNDDGTFTFSPNGFLNFGSEVTGVVVADVDQDAAADIVAVDPQSFATTELALFLNEDGEGQFASAQTLTAAEAPFAITAFDADNNGKVDLAVTTLNADPMAVLCQPSAFCNLQFEGEPLEAGIWRAPRFQPDLSLGGQGQVAIAAGRLNDDDLDDLVALAADLRTIGIFLNTSTAGTPGPTNPAGTATFTPTGPTATPAPTNTPRPTATPTAIPTVPLGSCQITLLGSLPTNVDPVAVTTADFDLDGRRDIAVADRAGNRVVVYYGALDAGGVNPNDDCNKLDLSRGQTIRNIAAPVDLAAADFDRDSRPDLAVIGSAGLTTLFGPGSRLGQFIQADPLAAGTQPTELAVEDFNRDGIPDVVVADASGTNVNFFLGSTDRDDPFAGEACPFNIRKRASRIVATDLNRDARPDFAIASEQTNDISVFLRNSGVTVDCDNISQAFGALAPISLSGPPRGLVSRVFDLADAIPDLAVGVASQTAAGQARLHLGQASGTASVRYGTGTTLADGGVPLTGPLTIATGDINRDARLDLIVLDSDGGDDVVIYLGLADGSFGQPLVPVSSGPGTAQALEVTDLDGDARDDIIVANANGTLTFFLSSDPPPTPTPANTATPTPVLSATATSTSVPTITETPTRTRRPLDTPTPVPTTTARGLIKLNGEGCAVAAGASAAGGAAWWPLLALVGILAARKRQR